MATKNSTTSYNVPAPQTDGALHDAPMLELPDWSGMKEHRVTMTFAEACQWNEEMLALFPPRPDSADRRAKARCEVPFAI